MRFSLLKIPVWSARAVPTSATDQFFLFQDTPAPPENCICESPASDLMQHSSNIHKPLEGNHLHMRHQNSPYLATVSVRDLPVPHFSWHFPILLKYSADPSETAYQPVSAPPRVPDVQTAADRFPVPKG